VGDQPVVDQGEFVAEAFEALPHRHLLVVLQLIKSAVFGGVDEVGECGIEGVEGHLHRTALFALVWYAVPELHTDIIFEDAFDDKAFS
jgi:hypothetical protein